MIKISPQVVPEFTYHHFIPKLISLQFYLLDVAAVVIVGKNNLTLTILRIEVFFQVIMYSKVKKLGGSFNACKPNCGRLNFRHQRGFVVEDFVILDTALVAVSSLEDNI